MLVELPSGKNIDLTFQRFSNVTLVYADMDGDLFVGRALRAPEDQENAKVGRKMALRDLFKHTNFDKTDRTHIWEILRPKNNG